MENCLNKGSILKVCQNEIAKSLSKNIKLTEIDGISILGFSIVLTYSLHFYYYFQSESDTKQEDLESAFLRREGNYNFKRDGQEFRLQFFLNPMCEKSFRPYSKKTVRRRPVFRSPEDIRKLTRGNVKKTSWFSFRNLFR